MVASVTMLGLLLTRFDLSVLNPIDELSSWTWVATGVAVTFGAVVLATLRWQRVLQALDLPSDLHTLLNHVLAGIFVSNFLPSTVGGDVLRVTRLSAGNGHPPESFASVVLERLTGFVVLPFITLVALVGNPTLLHMGTATQLALTLSLGTLAVLVVILLVAGNSRLGARLAGHGPTGSASWAPSTWGSTACAGTRARPRRCWSRPSPTSSPSCSRPGPRATPSASTWAGRRPWPSCPSWPSPRCCRCR